ncbi:tetratricopeptide repeat protein [Kordiimonas sp. SCSIO 12610]|uniref:tetratricopeptide repeat protein n=1 Tax=Kordiimonas sp. SCSIO 12610 TaxID=2829597 RepID=UPI0021093D6C|nr:hypothetical protein [Kordiimonas sp. SCSIO 12610]UTW55582.1 sel1 repeat family protein [Kordiimonas sp. SCSIO 12610]
MNVSIKKTIGGIAGLVCLAAAYSSALLAFEPKIQQSKVNVQAADVNHALIMIRQGSFNEGSETLRALGNSGSAEAYFHLGQIHRLGIQGEKSDEVATMYYRLSNELGHKRAGMILANLLFFKPNRTASEEDEAIKIWQDQALIDDAEAQYLLGTVYWNGDGGLGPDPIRGYGLIWRASELGHGEAKASEVLMASDLSFEARHRARLYADNLRAEGFEATPLEIELIFDAIATAAGDLAPADDHKPWQINVGFSHSNDRLPSYKALLEQDVGAYLEDLEQKVVQTQSGQFLVTYGPIASLDQAVSRCVFLKKKGYDCSADIVQKTPLK